MTGRPTSSEKPLEAALTLAVIIPTLNEESHLPGLLASLRQQSQAAERVLVVDAGSTDATLLEAGQAGAEVLRVAHRGRGGQVAAGIGCLEQDVILVAHADMKLPTHALECVRRVLTERPDCPGGCLGHCFDQPALPLRIIEWCDRRRAFRGESYGDQAQFFRREMLQSVGGVPDQSIMEDVELSRRLRVLGEPVYLDMPVTVSARRFQQLRWWKVLWTNWRLRREYRRKGVSACQELYERYYRKG